MNREHRINERFAIGIDVTLETADGRVLSMRLSNISTGGAFLVQTEPATPLPPAGSTIRFTIRHQSERGAEVVTERARVIRTGVDGIAVEFLHDAPALTETG